MIGRRPEPLATIPHPSPDRCAACHRTQTRLETRNVNGEPTRLCVDPVDCRRHWAVEDQPRWAR